MAERPDPMTMTTYAGGPQILMPGKRVDQTILATDPKRVGNCVSACVATYLDVPLETVPHFVEHGSDLAGDDTDPNAWWWLLVGYLAAYGLWPVDLPDLAHAELGEMVFASGPSPRGIAHQVLYRDGVLWHDPHPSRDGILEVAEVIAFRPRLHDHEPTLRTEHVGGCNELCDGDDHHVLGGSVGDCAQGHIDLIDRPESDTWACGHCGAEGTGPA